MAMRTVLLTPEEEQKWFKNKEFRWEKQKQIKESLRGSEIVQVWGSQRGALVIITEDFDV
ncbi:MAG: hypothetical protein HQM14_14505 [SAR324 cluster bacterium]|nr:hypothetical protein [SAR324 cluster bacterium]